MMMGCPSSHLCPRVPIFLASHLGQGYHHPQDPRRKLKSSLDVFSLLLSFPTAALARFKQSSCRAWPVATASDLFSLSPVFPLKIHPGMSTSIFLGSTFTWFVASDGPSQLQRRKPSP